ncbi:flagellin [Microvirga sp. Mcv34]|uniref:flagellin n=1 Tax=Microvirga sp. Mcv34 TaxID=2926016 RepID=UPI0021C91309|nr:flagellin [Microvirga sp. Mcv34]
MSSILTNASALTALRNLSNTQNALSKTQSQISTGLKVGSASDNTTNWSVSTQMKTDNSVIGTIKERLKQNSDLLTTASSALDGLVNTVDKIKVELAKAADAKTDAEFTAIGTSLTKLSEELTKNISNAALNGVNLLDGSKTDPIKMVSGFAGGTGADTFNFIEFTAVDISDAATTATDTFADVADSDTAVDAAKAVETFLGVIRDYAVELGAAKNQIEAQSKFLGVLSESLTNSVSSLVDADMNEASTRLQALQTQQQLGVQSLSIANQNSQMILRLFQ